MEEVEAMEMTEVTSEQIALELEDETEKRVDDTKAELFSALRSLTAREANKLVRSCEDTNGYTAWKRLYDRFNPKTPASLRAGCDKAEEVEGLARSRKSQKCLGRQSDAA